MLIHLTPRFLTCSVSGDHPKLERLEIPEFHFCGREGVDIDTRRPYPNKRYQVGCRKVGKKAISGLLFDVEDPPECFSMIARWQIAGGGIVVHKIDYVLNDREFDASSDEMTLWSAPSEDGHHFKDRYIDLYLNTTPAGASPRMVASRDASKQGVFEDQFESGILVFREEKFIMPSIEKARLKVGYAKSRRVPEPKYAFQIKKGKR